MNVFAEALAGNGYRVADRAPVVFNEPPLTLADLIGPAPAWHRDAARREHPEMSWFPGAMTTPPALIEVCAGCLVRAGCADAGMAKGSGI